MSTVGNVYAAWFWMHLLAACIAAGVVMDWAGLDILMTLVTSNNHTAIVELYS